MQGSAESRYFKFTNPNPQPSMSSVNQSSGSSGSMSSASGSGKKGWTKAEEIGLIDNLKDLISQGLKSDNGWKTGYMKKLVNGMNRDFPGCGIQLKHVDNKLSTWRRDFTALHGLMTLSGIQWNSEDHNIIVKDEEEWSDYVKTNKKVVGLRNKCFPYYEEWLIVFGKDKATGSGTEGCLNMCEDIVKGPRKEKEPETAPVDGPTTDLSLDDMEMYDHSDTFWTFVNEDGSESVNETTNDGGEPDVHSPRPNQAKKRGGPQFSGKKNSAEKKKKNALNDEDKSDMDRLMAAAADTWANLSLKFNNEEDSFDEKAKKLVHVLSGMPGLSKEARSYLTFKLAENPRHISLFLHSPSEDQKVQVNMLLDGKFDIIP